MNDIKERLIQSDIELIQGLNKEIVLLEKVIASQDHIIEKQTDMLVQAEVFVLKLQQIVNDKEEITNERI